MRTRFSLHRRSSWSSTSVERTDIEPARTTSTDEMVDPAMDRTRWPTGMTAGAVGSVLRRLAATPARVWSRRPRTQRQPLQIGSGLDIVADAGHILRTRPPTGSFVPTGTSVDYVVASEVSGSGDEPVGDSNFVDHDATARPDHEAT